MPAAPLSLLGALAPPVTPLPIRGPVYGLGFDNMKVAEAVVSPIQLATVLNAQSAVNQVPAGLGVPLQVTFGPAQGVITDPVMISAAGLVTVNIAGNYFFTINLNFTRTTSPGSSFMAMRSMVNGVQFNPPILVEISDADNTLFQQIQNVGFFPAGTTIAIQVARDPAGNNNGQLEAIACTGALASWGTGPSAIFRIVRLSL